MRVVRGDLFDEDTQVIAHGVNCKGLMGAGIAKAFRAKYPDMYKEYRMMCQEEILRPGGIFPYKVSDTLTVMNIASQEWPGPDASLQWLQSGLKSCLNYMRDRQLSMLAMPWIGCGIGGLNVSDVEGTILYLDFLFPEIEITVCEL